jgi:ubiquinone/menaquinone biosynthesis C-methylase UbiE
VQKMARLNSLALPVLGTVDVTIRMLTGRGHLPPFSLRTRTGSPIRMLGGGKWTKMGEQMLQEVKDFCGLLPTHHVTEIGCSCGIVAIPLKSFLTTGTYTGLDIIPESITWCQTHLGNEQFRFIDLNVRHDLYNPAGKGDSDHIQLPVDDNTMDVVFLVSVFTHMMPQTVQHYLQEISRILKPQGRCLATMLTKDRYVPGRAVFNLQYQKDDDCLCWDEENPTFAVALSSASIGAMAEHARLKVFSMSPGRWDGQTWANYLHDMYVFKKS